MAGKGGTTRVAAAAGVAAGAGAAQLGLGYGLGVVTWPATSTPDDSVWLGSLGWATWIAASATVFGAVIATRLHGGPAARSGEPWRFTLAASAAVGALLTVALIALPARSAVRADTFAPQTIAAGYAVAGILLGLVIAYWAVVSRPVAANLIATAGYLWALAATAIVVELITGRDSATYLTSWQFAELGGDFRYGAIYWPSALLTLLAALLVGAIAAWPAVRRGNFGIGAASSGAVGPLLVASAFLLLAPQLTGSLDQLQSAFLIAPYAVLAGLAGSAIMVAYGQRSAQRGTHEYHRPTPPTATGIAPVPTAVGGSSDRANSDSVRSEPTGATAAASPELAGAKAAASPEPVGATAAASPSRRPAETSPDAEPATSDRPVAPTSPVPRSTVAAPPSNPPIAKINSPRHQQPGPKIDGVTAQVATPPPARKRQRFHHESHCPDNAD